MVFVRDLSQDMEQAFGDGFDSRLPHKKGTQYCQPVKLFNIAYSF